eukprot:6220342-Prorocentrum_lima.AAC.1
MRSTFAAGTGVWHAEARATVTRALSTSIGAAAPSSTAGRPGPASTSIATPAWPALALAAATSRLPVVPASGGPAGTESPDEAATPGR